MNIHISVLTVFEQLYKPFLQTSLINRAHQKGIVDINVSNFFSYVTPKERIDAPTFGPGVGMLIRPQVVEQAIEDKEHKYGPAFKIFFSPQGKKLDQRMLEYLARVVQQKSHVLLVSSRYEGMDARVEEHYADITLSVGDFVLMGGDIPAMLFLEGLLRLFPGVVGNEESVKKESFSEAFVDFPSYTAPVHWKGKEVPSVVRSGNHAEIYKWRTKQAAQKTVLHHFNWLSAQCVTNEQKYLAQLFIPSHYLAVFYSDIVPKNQQDERLALKIVIEDIACSAKMYGIKNVFIITQSEEQKKIVIQLLSDLQTDRENRYRATDCSTISLVTCCDSVQEVIRTITEQKEETPLMVAVFNQVSDKKEPISFYDQSKLWKLGHPVLFLFAASPILTKQLTEHSNFFLPPITSFSDFDFLTIKQKITVVLDRWLGINLKQSKTSLSNEFF